MSAGKQASVMIVYDDKTYNDTGELINIENRRIFLDAVEETSVNASSNITTHPIVTGDMVGDHMLKEPVSMSFSGEISKNGSNNIICHFGGYSSPITAARTLTITDMSFAEIEQMFEDIKNKGLLCEVMKSSSGQEFMSRESMALTSIQWRERINSLSFTLTFTQVFVVDIEISNTTEDEKAALLEDENLPNITEPAVLSFAKETFTSSHLETEIDTICHDSGLMSDDFYNYVVMNTVPNTNKTAVNIGKYVQLGVGLFSPAVWIANVAGLITKGAIKTSFRVKQFENWEDMAEVVRYKNFRQSLVDKLSQLTSKLFIYEITENQPQTCTITINSTQYDFVFKRDNIILGKETWYLTVNESLTETQVKGSYAMCAAKTSMDECTSSNALFVTNGGQYVYAIQTKEGNLDDLRNYGIFVSTIAPSEINKEIANIINDAIYYSR